MRIEPVERDQAAPVVQRIYDAIEKSTGRVSPFFRMLGNKPELLRAFNQLYGVVWAEGALAAKLKEPGLPAGVDPERLRLLNAVACRFG